MALVKVAITEFAPCAEGDTCDEHGPRDHRIEMAVSTPEPAGASKRFEDVAVLDLTTATPVAGPATLTRWIDISLLAPTTVFTSSARSEAVQAGDYLTTIGFPPLAGKPTERPVLTSGVIASDPCNPPSDDFLAHFVGRKAAGRYVLADSHSRGGMSGGMVVAPQRGLLPGAGLSGTPDARRMWIVGVNAGHLRPDEHGITHAYFYRSDAIIECLTSLWG